jgi:hypothetical protein
MGCCSVCTHYTSAAISQFFATLLIAAVAQAAAATLLECSTASTSLHCLVCTVLCRTAVLMFTLHCGHVLLCSSEVQGLHTSRAEASSPG